MRPQIASSTSTSPDPNQPSTNIDPGLNSASAGNGPQNYPIAIDFTHSSFQPTSGKHAIHPDASLESRSRHGNSSKNSQAINETTSHTLGGQSFQTSSHKDGHIFQNSSSPDHEEDEQARKRARFSVLKEQMRKIQEEMKNLENGDDEEIGMKS